MPPLMYPHPELGCGGKLRFDDHRCRWPITQCAVRSMVIVVSSPRGGQYLRFLYTGEDLTVKQFISELTIEAFDIAILPWAARLDQQRLHAQPGEPGSHRPGHELRSVVRADVFRNAMLQHQLCQRDLPPSMCPHRELGCGC